MAVEEVEFENILLLEEGIEGENIMESDDEEVELEDARGE